MKFKKIKMEYIRLSELGDSIICIFLYATFLLFYAAAVMFCVLFYLPVTTVISVNT